MRRRLVATAGMLCLAAALSAQPAVDLIDVPEPSLEALPEADRELLGDLREEARVAVGAGAPPSEIGSRYGALGRAYLLHDLVEPAAAALGNARRLDPGTVDWVYFAGVLHQREGEIAEAEAAFREVLEREPEDVAARVRLGQVRFVASDLAGAAEAFREALSRQPGIAAALYGLGQIAYAEGRDSEAIEHLEAALAAQPSATSIHHLLGLAHRRAGDLEAAKRHLAANRHDPVDLTDPRMDALPSLLRGSPPHLKAGTRAANAGDFQRAIGHFRRAIEVEPTDPLAHYNLALALVRTGDPGGAIGALERAVELDPGYRDAHYNLATTLAGLGRWSEAAAHFRRAAEIDPLDAGARLGWARAELAAGNGTEARRLLESLATADGSVSGEARTEALLLLADLTERAGDPADAESRLREALEPGSPQVFEALGSLLGRQGRFREAAGIYGRAVERWPASPQARFGQVMALLLAGADREARAALEDAVVALPESLELRHLLARVLAASPDPAVRDPARALELATDLANRRSTLTHGETVAMALAASGRFEEAAALQSRLVDAARRETGVDPRPLERRLASYRAGEPVTAPWRPQ